MADAGIAIDRSRLRHLRPVIVRSVSASAVLLVVGWVIQAGPSAWVNFLVVGQGLLIGALPLVILGAVAAGIIAAWVPDEFFARVSRLPEAVQLPAAALCGLAFPVCECGSVPVARRAIARGLSPQAAIAFMLSAPILNPIVVLSTTIAYRGRPTFLPVLLGRLGLGFLAAVAVAWIIGNRMERFDHVGDDCAHGCACDTHHTSGDRGRVHTFVTTLSSEALYMGRFLVIGAAAAAAMQTIVPASVLYPLGGAAVVSTIAMMALAFVLSLCSESDAFVAASMVQFGPGPQLAFLVFGPMMDAKLAFMYSATFGRWFVRTVALVVGSVALVGSVWIEVLFT
ncbi:MAG: permease [Actinomycetota bacterium]